MLEFTPMKYTALFFLVCLAFLSNAQVVNNNTTPEYFTCGHSDAEEKLLEKHPEIKIEREKYAKELALRQHENYTNANKKADDLYVIPVVFHIIHNNGTEKIDYDQVLSAVTSANLDLSGNDPDVASVNATFAGIVADSKIELRLATIDPDGNCTNGVVYYEDAATAGADDGVKSNRQWPRDQYLNVYVVKSIGSGAAGYAYYPGVGAANDGILIRHDYVGNEGTSSEYKSAALVHELGHYLNLRHTWGNSNTPADAGNCSGDDLVTDTPNCIGISPGSAGDCSGTFNTCNDGAGDLIDNHQNYMEYSYCFIMFTDGQKARMRAALESGISERSSLITPANLAATGTSDGLSPALCQVQIAPASVVDILIGESVDFSDQSTISGINSWLWTFEGGNIATSNQETVTVTYNTPGLYQVSLEVSNGTVTESSTFFARVNVTDLEEVYVLDFSVPANWTSVSEAGSPASAEWDISVSGNATQNAYMGKISSTTAANGFAHTTAIDLTVGAPTPYNDIDTYIEYDALDLSGVTNDMTFQFEQRYTAFNSDNCYVEFSNNNGANWSQIEVNAAVVVNDDGASIVTIALDDSYKVNNFKFRFRWTADNRDPNYNFGGGYGWQVDDISILHQIFLPSADWVAVANSGNWNVASNWGSNAVPTSADDITLDHGFVAPGYTVTVTADASVGNLTFDNADINLVIEAGVTFNYSSISGNGNITLENGASLVPNAGQSGAVAGSFTVKRNKPSGQNAAYYNFWSSPIASGNSNMLTGAQDLYSLAKGAGSASTYYSAFSGAMTNGRGYAATNVATATFTGTVNNGTILYGIEDNSGSGDGVFNLIGNPYPSAIDADEFISDNGPAILDGAIYLWNQVDANDRTDSENSQSNFIAVNYSGGSTYDNTATLGTINIASGQGFGVAAAATGNITFENDQRNGLNSDFKSDKTLRSAEYAWFSIAQEGQDQSILVAFGEQATNASDFLYDAHSFETRDNLQIAAMIKNDLYLIDAMPLTDAVNNVPLSVTVPKAGAYQISLNRTESLATTRTVLLRDKQEGKEYAMEMGTSIAFNTSTPFFTQDRFELVFTNHAVGINENRTSKVFVWTSTQRGVLNLKSLNATTADYSLYSPQGQLIHSGILPAQSNKNINLVSGVYLIHIAAGDTRRVERIIVQ